MSSQYYVYVHETLLGEVFYVGKGVGNRAWSKDRDLNWNLFVEKHLNNKYNVRILAEQLTETQAVFEEENLMSKYGDLLVNRQNPSRSLNMSALNIRDEIEAKLKKSELDAELSDDLNEKADLFIQALNYHKQLASIITENGLLGKLLAERPLGCIQLLDKAVRSLVAAERKEQAQAIFDQYFFDYPHDKELTKVLSISKALKRNTLKLTEQENFIPPEPLPTGWQYAKERNKKALRLDHKMYETDKSSRYDLDVLKILKDKDLAAAMLYLKQWIVQDERIRRKNPLDNELWLYSEAGKIAKKQKNLLEECLFQMRFTALLGESDNQYGKNLIKLRKLAAKQNSKDRL